MHYLNEFDLTPSSTDAALDKLHRMALEAQIKEQAIKDMKADGCYVSEELLVNSFI
jgi:hypothetical protein|tara:strand:- start:605 stop:772 length:168 start_codon:yes stop_codon:yes gene_type:complete